MAIKTDKVLAHSVRKRQTNDMKEELIISNSNCGNVFEGNRQDSHIYSRTEDGLLSVG